MKKFWNIFKKKETEVEPISAIGENSESKWTSLLGESFDDIDIDKDDDFVISPVIKNIPEDRNWNDTPQIAYILSKALDFCEEKTPAIEITKKMTEYYGFDKNHPLECRNSAINYLMELFSYDRVTSVVIDNIEEIQYRHNWDVHFEPIFIYRKIEKKINDGELTFTKINIYDEEELKICANFYENKYFNEYLDINGINGLETWLIKISDEVVGFSSFQDVNNSYHLCGVILKEQLELTDYHKKIQEFILEQIPNKKKNIHIYLTTEEEKDFYKSIGFKLYKDFKTFEPGQNLMRFVMNFEFVSE